MSSFQLALDEDSIPHEFDKNQLGFFLPEHYTNSLYESLQAKSAIPSNLVSYDELKKFLLQATDLFLTHGSKHLNYTYYFLYLNLLI